MNSGSGVGLVLMVVAIAVLCGLIVLVNHQRRQRLMQWAQNIGWTYADRDDGYVHLQSGDPFGEGYDQRAVDVLAGRYEGMPAVSFTYRWTTGHDKDKQTHDAHVVALALPAYLPVVEVTPEGIGARLGKLFGAQDIQFESDDFNRAYRVTAFDERVAHAVLHPRLMERLLRSDALGCRWRIEGTWIASATSGGMDLDAIAPRLGVLSAVVRSIPRHVWLDHGYDPTSPENLRRS